MVSTLTQILLAGIVCTFVATDCVTEFNVHKKITKESAVDFENFAMSVKSWLWLTIIVVAYMKPKVSKFSLALGLPLVLGGAAYLVNMVQKNGISVCYGPQYTDLPAVSLEKARLMTFLGIYFTIQPTLFQSR